MKLTLDFETYSEADLRKVGAVKYAQHPSTDIICMSWAEEDGPVHTWAPGLPFPVRLKTLILGRCSIEAHGALFERAIWRWVAKPLYMFPDVEEEQWRDTMAVCGYKAVPLKLEKAARALELTHQKDMAGHRAMLQVSKPDRSGQRVLDFEKTETTYNYCDDDVLSERELSGVVGELPAPELSVWQLDQKINLRGVKVDIPFVDAALDILHQVGARYTARLSEITAGYITSVGQVARIIEWCHDNGCDIPNLQKETVDYWLTQAEGPVWEVLRARQVIGGAASKKYQAARDWAGEGDRARGLLQYHAATTGRWAGRGIQPQNMVMSDYHGDPEVLVRAIVLRDPEFLDMIHKGGSMQALSDAVKMMFIADKERLLAVGDFNTIEFRILMRLSGQWDMVKKLARGEDPYLDFGKELYGRTITKEDDPVLRQVSKHCVLGLGFGMGKDKLADQIYKNSGGKITIDPELRDRAVDIYRVVKYPKVPLLWKAYQNASILATVTGKPVPCGEVEFEMRGAWLSIRLPSGRRLWFYKPVVRTVECPWHTGWRPAYQETLFFWAYKNGHWQRIKSYGAMIVAIVTQAIDRDFLVHAMFALEREDYPVVLNIHDEAVTEPRRDRRPDAREFEQIMTDLPPWGVSYPIAAEAWVGERYRK